MKLTARTNVKVNLDVSARSRKAAESAAKLVFPELNSAFQDAIGSKVWSWPRETMRGATYRKDGSRTPGRSARSPRDIVDTGILKASNSFQISGTLATFKWSVDYAAAAHYGANIYPWGDKSRPKVNLPARPWTSAVLGTINIGGIEPYDYRSQFKAAFVSAWRRSS
jgi:hypothetical protein